MERKQTLEDYGFIKTKSVEPKSDINDLPTELMVMIFKFLTPSERRKMITVCQRWLNIVNTYFHQDHCLILKRNTDYSLFGSLYQTFLKRLTLTQHLRTFSHLVVDTIPKSSTKRLYFLKFLELVGNEITDLKIMAYVKPDGFIKQFYGKFPNVTTLEVDTEDFLKELPCDTKVKIIKISTCDDFKVLKQLRKLKTIESITVDEFELTIEHFQDNNVINFMETKTIRALISLFGDATDGLLNFQTNANLCGERKMTLKDVEGIRLADCITTLSPNTFDGFENLKKLKFYHSDDLEEENILMTERAYYSNITHITYEGVHELSNPHFFKSFPNLEYLKIDSLITDFNFSTICQFMPNLKEFIVEGDYSQLTVYGLFAELKHLKLLERLEITFNEGISYVNGVEWPYLRYLKELSLTGKGLKLLNERFYSEVANRSPKINTLCIDYNSFNIIENNMRKFIPLLRDLKITDLTLPGNNKNNDNNNDNPNADLINIILPHCNTLKSLCLKDINGFTLAEELFLFKTLPSLETITSRIPDSQYFSLSDERVMTRKDSKNLKQYLKKTIRLYTNLNNTTNFILDNINIL